MCVFGALENFKLLEHLPTQGVLRKHTLDGLFQDAFGLLSQELFKIDGLQVADVTSVVMVHLVLELSARNVNFFGIDYNNVVAGVHVGSKYRLMLAAQTKRDLGSQSSEGLVGRVNYIPVALYSLGFCGNCFHR